MNSNAEELPEGLTTSKVLWLRFKRNVTLGRVNERMSDVDNNKAICLMS